MGERLCPMTKDGRHLVLKTAWGQSCRACHRTWVWRDKSLEPTWPDALSDQGKG